MDSIDGGDGNDDILNQGNMYQNLGGGNFSGEINGGAGDDTITNDVNANVYNVEGGDGDDIIINRGSVTTGALSGNEGDDIIVNYGAVEEDIDGGIGNDTITNEGVTTSITGDEGDDTIINESNATVDYIYGSGGNDSITNRGKVIYRIYGDEGDDTIINESNATVDYIYGDDFNQNGCGNDTIINAGVVKGNIYGGKGNDTIINESIATVSSNIGGGDGDDIIINNGNVRSISGGLGNDSITNNGIVDESIDGDDLLSGKKYNNTIINNGTVKHAIGCGGVGNNIIINNGKVLSGIRGNIGNDIMINTGTIGYTIDDEGDDIIITSHNSTTDQHTICAGDDTFYLNAVSNNLWFRDIENNLYSWLGDDLVIKYNNNIDSVVIKNYNPNNANVIVNVNDINLATLVPEKPQINSIISVGLTDLKIISDIDEYFTFVSNSINDNTIYQTGLDKKYDILDTKGIDILNIVSDTNSSDLSILFNVKNSYRTTNGIDFGAINILETQNIENWKAKNTFKEIVVENNSVETINFNNKTISSSDIAQLAEKVAIWLTDGGRDYACVNAVLNSGNTTDINNLITYFADNTNWQTIE